MTAAASALTPEILLAAYANGYFPMAEQRDSTELRWFCPEQRGVLPLDAFHIPKSLAKAMRKSPFVFTTDRAFPEVIRACANREETWINDDIIALYCQLARDGYGHSVECWHEGALVGGLYGIALGGAFFGESMFSTVSNASKMALVYLVQRLNQAGYRLLDAQFVNDHLQQFGIIEVPREAYLQALAAALRVKPAACF